MKNLRLVPSDRPNNVWPLTWEAWRKHSWRKPPDGRHPRKRNWDIVAIPVAIVIVAILAGAWLSADPPDAKTQAISNGRITVVDGDTIRVGGKLTRLVGFNAPETWEPLCDNERQVGVEAKTRLGQIVAAGNLSFASVACSCRHGTEGTQDCNYGRACGTLRANNRDVGSILIDEGLAVRYLCGATTCPSKPRPWC
jgi:endonuclease YncB( thermonuclease family)